jgi:hypothetical protein
MASATEWDRNPPEARPRPQPGSPVRTARAVSGKSIRRYPAGLSDDSTLEAPNSDEVRMFRSLCLATARAVIQGTQGT